MGRELIHIMENLDRFAQGLEDTVGKDLEVYTYCASCKGELYIGDDVIDVDSGVYCCNNLDCVLKYWELNKVVLGEDE